MKIVRDVVSEVLVVEASITTNIHGDMVSRYTILILCNCYIGTNTKRFWKITRKTIGSICYYHLQGKRQRLRTQTSTVGRRKFRVARETRWNGMTVDIVYVVQSVAVACRYKSVQHETNTHGAELVDFLRTFELPEDYRALN